MDGFDLLVLHNKQIIDNNLFSTKCILTNSNGDIQGTKDDDEQLKCFAPFIGIELQLDTGLPVFGDSCEVTMNMASIKIGKPVKGWKIDIFYPLLAKWMAFEMQNIAEDRMLGWYYFKVTAVKKQSEAKRIERLNIGGL